jgi:hypothetical protein
MRRQRSPSRSSSHNSHSLRLALGPHAPDCLAYNHDCTSALQLFAAESRLRNGGHSVAGYVRGIDSAGHPIAGARWVKAHPADGASHARHGVAVNTHADHHAPYVANAALPPDAVLYAVSSALPPWTPGAPRFLPPWMMGRLRCDSRGLELGASTATGAPQRCLASPTFGGGALECALVAPMAPAATPRGAAFALAV